MLASLFVLSTPLSEMSARRLILVRHGAVSRQPRASWPGASQIPVKDGAFYGSNFDVPLSARGEAEAAAAAAHIASVHPQEVCAVWSSTMSRAKYGAHCIAKAVGVDGVAEYDAFRELDRGLWANKTVAEVEAEFGGPGVCDRCAREDDFGRLVAKGEGMGDLRKRVLDQRDALLGSVPPGRAAVIVSHLWVTRALIGDVTGERDPLAIDIPTASVSVVDYPADGGAPTVVSTGFKPALSKEDEERLADVKLEAET